MVKHVKPYNNENKAIITENDTEFPLGYFNRIVLQTGEEYQYRLKQYETVCVVVQGKVNISVDGEDFGAIGEREDLFAGKPDSVYAPIDSQVVLKGITDGVEIFVAGGLYEKKLVPFRVSPSESEKVQYGSDETKTHRKIYHILGQNAQGRVGRLLVSELFTVGAGGWSGFPPHKHDENRLPIETNHPEIYHFKFNPKNGFGAQFAYAQEEDFGPVFHVKNDSTFYFDKGYHPVCVAPGYEMYYFTILIGEKQRSLVQYFQPEHAHQLKTIPGMQDMIDKFK